MALGAVSHRPALRRPRRVGRSSVYRGKGGARLPPWCRSSPLQGQHRSPHTGTGLEKVAQTKLAPSNPVSIPQLVGHPITWSKTSQESTNICHAVWSMEREDTHGHHAQQQARANDRHRRHRQPTSPTNRRDTTLTSRHSARHASQELET